MKDRIETTAANEMQNAECRMQNGQQLALSFSGFPPLRPGYRQQQKLRAQAKGWFDTMRRIVDNAVEWKPIPPARPQQTALDLRRETEVQLAK
jgi:hypothetical protein